MTAEPNQLHPDLLPLYIRLVSDLTAKGYVCRAITTYRSPEAEDALSSSVTSVTGKTSKHCFTIDGKPASKAFDLGFFDKDGSYVADGSDQRYTDAGALWLSYTKIFPALGLVWGGVWHTPHDPDHFQIA